MLCCIVVSFLYVMRLAIPVIRTCCFLCTSYGKVNAGVALLIENYATYKTNQTGCKPAHSNQFIIFFKQMLLVLKETSFQNVGRVSKMRYTL